MKRTKLLCVLVFMLVLLFATTAYSACDEVVFVQDSLIIKDIPDDKFPTDVSPGNQICYVKVGTTACVIDKKYYETSTLFYLKLVILDGDCTGKIGWANSSYTKGK